MGKIPNEVIGRANSVLTLGNTIMRGAFISLFTFPLFAEANVVYAYGVLATFALVAAFILIVNYKKF